MMITASMRDALLYSSSILAMIRAAPSLVKEQAINWQQFAKW